MAIKTTISLLLLLVSTTLLVRPSDAVVSCGDVASKAAACVGFVTGKVPKPPATCCGGLQQLAHGAATVDDRRAICRCLKNGVKAFPGVKDQFLGQVPKACNIPVGFPVSLNTNCDKVN